MKINRICVYCGSSPGRSPAFSLAAASLAETMCERGIGLVYGGAAVGVMGAVANAVLDAGGEAIGVIPKSLAIKEVAHENLTELHVVSRSSWPATFTSPGRRPLSWLTRNTRAASCRSG